MKYSSSRSSECNHIPEMGQDSVFSIIDLWCDKFGRNESSRNVDFPQFTVEWLFFFLSNSVSFFTCLILNRPDLCQACLGTYVQYCGGWSVRNVDGYHQYCGGFSVYRGGRLELWLISGALGNTISSYCGGDTTINTVEDMISSVEDVQNCKGIPSILWWIFSTLMKILWKNSKTEITTRQADIQHTDNVRWLKRVKFLNNEHYWHQKRLPNHCKDKNISGWKWRNI